MIFQNHVQVSDAGMLAHSVRGHQGHGYAGVCKYVCHILTGGQGLREPGSCARGGDVAICAREGGVGSCVGEVGIGSCARRAGDGRCAEGEGGDSSGETIATLVRGTAYVSSRGHGA